MEWVTLPAQFTDKGLYINNTSIVEAWEGPIQEKLAESVCIISDLGILEIGYGLGLSARRVQNYNTKFHILIEAHPDVAKRAKRELSDKTSIIVDFWEEAITWFTDKLFDGIIFDSYPFSSMPYNGSIESTFEFVVDFIKKGERLLKKGGRLAFLDFSCELHTVAKFEEMVRVFFSSYLVTSVPLSIPKDCTYAKGTKGNIIVLIK